jgi:hypothetical protein
MNKYEFSLILKGSLELTEDIADKLFASGCDDGTPGTCNGVFSIDFHREAPSLEAAIQSAVKNVQAAGYEVERVEIEAAAIPV